MKRIVSWVIATALTLSLFSAFANVNAAASETVSTTVSGYVSAVGGDIEIASKTKTPKIYVDSSDYEGVVLAANDLKADIEAVTGAKPEIINSLDTSEGGTGVVLGNAPKLITGTTIENGKGIIAVYKGSGTLSSVQFSENYSDGVFTFEKAVNLSQGETVKGMVWSNDDKQIPLTPVYGEFAEAVDISEADIIIGTIGKSETIDDLISSGKLDVSEVEDEWEAFTLQNVDNTLVIAGADKRGTMYGVYDLSEKMGVSPWEWWADVTPQHSDAIYVTLPSGGFTQCAPAVKYRGIFINQEYNLWNWSKSLATEGETGMNTATYEKIFHLMARLGANYMWPAMHEYSPAFNNNPINAQNADKYGIAMGGSHCEMLLRNNMGELLDFQTKWTAEHPDANLYMFRDGSLGKDVAYDYTDIDKEGNAVDNKQFLEDYWRERIKTNGKYENVYTVGMRGVHDGQWNPVVPSEYTTTKEKNQYKIDLLEEIITKQREILSEEIGKPASEIPQVFIPYKEILDLYNASVDNPLEIPEDITIMWTNDNFGHIRQGSTEAEMARSGGGGMYYHVSYHGKPTDVIWTAGTQLGLIKEEMSKAYDKGANNIWILNVGPLKPFENQMEYFIDLGRNMDKLRSTSVNEYVKDNARRYFGFDDTKAQEYADIQCEYLQLANSRRPEFMQQGKFSLTSYGDEMQKEADKYAALLQRSTALYNSLNDDLKPAFYELQLYAIKTANDVMDNYMGADSSVLYSSQSRGAGVNKYIKQSTDGRAAIDPDTALYNTMLSGKWNNVINPWQNKEIGSWVIKIASAKAADAVTELPYTKLGVAAENQTDLTAAAALEFSGYTKDVRFIDIFNQGTGSLDWRVTADKDWVTFNKTSGTVYDDDRIYAGIDWSNAPAGNSTATITVTQYIGETAVDSRDINVTLNNTVKSDLPEKTYAEANGYVSIEAEHYTSSVASGDCKWQEQDDLGRSGTSMKFVPDTAAGISDNSAYLEYDVNFETTGTFDVDVYRMPTLNERGSVRFAVGIDDAAPTVLSGTYKYTGSSDDRWGEGVLNNNETLTTQITVNEAGIHKIRLYGVDTGAIVDKMVITTGTKYASYYGAPESYNTTYNTSAAVMPEAKDAATNITGEITALFEPTLYISGLNAENGKITSADIIKLGAQSNAQITVVAYSASGAMLDSKTVTGDFSAAQMNEKVTVPVDFEIPSGTAEIQAIAYDSTETLNALSPAYTADEAAISLMATYDSGKITTRSDLAEYKGKEAICRITDDETGNEVYIRQETVSDDTFKTINTGALDGTYTVKFGVSGEGVVATEKAYTTVNITTDNEETADTLYSCNFDTDQTAASGNNVPVISGNAAYDEANGAVKLTSTDASGGALNINFDEAVKAVTGQKITVVSKVAYGRQSGKYTDYTISDSAGKELVSAHIQMYSSSSAQSLKIGGIEQIESVLPAGIAETKNKKNSGIDNGYSIYTTVLDPDAKTIELTVSNAEGESTFKGKFPEGSSLDLGSISFSTNHTYAARTSFVDDISVSRTTNASYTMSFDVKDSQNNTISNPIITVTDKTYNTVISPQQDGTYKLCEGLYEYTVTADGYGTVRKELELTPATPSKTISVTLPASSAKTANITVQYYDEESNKIKDDVTLSEEYETDGAYTIPSEYTKDFTLKTDGGLTNYYKFNASKSQVTAPYSDTITIRLEYNLTEQYNYYEDFESYEFSSDNWHVQSSSVPNPTFETDKTKYLKHTTLSSTTGGYMTFDEVNTTNKKAHITADVKFTEPTGSSKGNSQFAISNTKPSFSNNNITYGIKSDSAGHVIVLEYNGGSTFYVNGEAANMGFIGDWIHIEADADFGQKTIKITLTNEAGLSAEFDTSFFSSSLAGNVGSFYVRSAGSSGSVSVDNLSLKITGTAEPAIVSVLNNKSVYAFGDSIVYGHNAPAQSFMQLIANDYGMNLSMMAKNGATVIDSSNDILAQVNGAPSEAPDFVVFDGYTNDAYLSAADDSFNTSGKTDVRTVMGTAQGKNATTFNDATFCGAFEHILYTMKQKWPDTPIVFVTIHKSGGRTMEAQTLLRTKAMEICDEWGVSVVDMFTYEAEDGTILDTTDAEQMKAYIINGAGSHPNVAACQKYYIPAVVEGLTAAANGDDPEPTDTPTPQETQQPQETEQPTEPVGEYDNTAGHWKFDFGAEAENGYYGVSHDRSYTDSLDYGFVGIKEDDYKLSAGQYMDSFRTVKGQSITLANGTRTGDTPDNDFVALTDEQYPLRFAMAAENGGYYNVKVRLVNASDSETATVSLFAEKRHQLLTNKEIPAGEYIDYEFNADVETYYWKALNGQFKDDTLSIELVGKNAAISTIEVTKLEDKGTTLWVLGDSTGCDQPSNYPYYILNPYAGVGQALSKYLPKTIAVSNQGDGGIASGDANHYSIIKSQIKQGDYLYVEFGHNESSTAKYKENLETYYSDCHAKGAKLIIVGPIDRCQDKQFDASTGKWSSTLNGYSDTGKAFVQEKIAAGATDIAFVDLNASWIEFLNATTANVKEIRSADVYEKDSVYYYYKYKASGIDVSHINDAGADNAAYIFFTNAKAAVTAGASAAEGSYEEVNADVLSGLVTGMREETPFAINEEIVTAGKVPNSLYPTIPTESYDGYEAEITNAEFNDSGLLTSVTAKVEHYDGFEKKGIPYAVAIAEIYNADNTLKGTYQSTAATKYDATNGNGTFTLKFDNAEAILPEGGTYKIWLQGFTSDNTVMEGTDNQVSDYFTPASLSEVYLIGDKEDIKTPDTFLYYGMKEGAELNANNGWYLVGSSTKSAKLQSETASGEKIGYAELKKDSTSGSWYLYRAFDNKYTSGKITLETDLYYESGYMKFLLSNKTSEPNNTNASKGINQRIDAFYIGNDGKIYDGNNNALAAFPKNEWVHISYEADMDKGIQTLKVGDETYTYSISGLDTIIPSEVTITGLQQLNISGSSSYKMSARIRNTSAKHIVNSSLETRTLTVQSADNSQGTVSIADSEALTKTAQINSLITVSAEARSGYKFSGWYEDDMLISETAETQIRLHRNVTLTAKFIPLEKITLTAKADDEEHGTIYIDGISANSTDVDQGTEVELVAVSAEGYKFVGWIDEGENILSQSATYKITVNETMAVTANFVALTNGDKVWDFAKYVGENAVTGEQTESYSDLTVYTQSGDTMTNNGLVWTKAGATDKNKPAPSRYITYTPAKAGTLSVTFNSSYTASKSNNNPRMYVVAGEDTTCMEKTNCDNNGKQATTTGANKDTTVSIEVTAGKTYYIWGYCYNKSDAPFNITNITFTAATE